MNNSGHSSAPLNNHTYYNTNFAQVQEELPIEKAPSEAMLTCTEGKNKDSWNPDSGASNHVTNDYNNITFGTDFHGNQKVHIGNGTGLSIKHLENTYISSFIPSTNLLLTNMLHVPLITKNLLSVS